MRTDVLSLIIYGVCIVLFITNKFPKPLVALTSLIIMILLNIVSFGDAFKNFAGKTTILIGSVMIIGKAINETGLAYSISQGILKLPIKRERTLIVITTLLTAVLSAFLSNLVVYMLIVSIVEHLCREKKEYNSLNFVLPIAMASVVGATITLVGGAVLPTASGILEEYIGKEFSFFTTSGVSIIINLILTLYVGIIGYPIGKKIWKNRVQNIKQYKEKNNISISKSKYKRMIIILCVTLIAFIFVDKISSINQNINTSTISLISALLCILSGCVSYKEAMKGIDLDVIIWLSATLGIAAGLINSGGSKLMADILMSKIGNNISPLLLYSIFVIIVAVLTQFLSNSATVSLILPIMCSITIDMGLNTYSFAIGVAMAGTLGIATPLASSSLSLAATTNYRFTDFIKYCLPITVIETVALITVIPIVYPLV